MISRLCAAAVALALTAAVAGCGGSDTTAFGEDGGDGSTAVRLVQQPWEDLIVENQIVSDILTKLGYSPSAQEVSVPLGAQALSTGKADAYLGNWWPSQESVFGKLIDAGSVEVTGTLLTGTEYAPGIPGDQAAQLKVSSLADLDKHADVFKKEILGIEPGTPGNQYILDAIKKDAYGLGDWKLVQSSTEAMLAEVTRRVGKNQPVVFLAWKPHWMVVKWKVDFLDDPEKVWPGAGQIRVLTRKGLKTDDPNLTKFLSQISVDPTTASEWIDAFGNQKKSAKDIASAWLAANEDTVTKWLDGVKTADGKDGVAAVVGG
ncbi:glycine betaine ABC transporter substrate-binding protein [Cryptosporangium aurantiacum]|uniref:Glycine betaine/proline transport system substrate-binding protein n=1 Tax=Cryptosporangium aurantiacum TaxID=134849 RepID=A0A1M7TVZ4_9ACTN|nr:glycine betaine ABC transporter substrate-binding protein [Cryptosporangium aurantiacum]SHN74919.1 glycine betaine/proline transport system substrate-binding protein [Cryptosporangium aurantiacum]